MGERWHAASMEETARRLGALGRSIRRARRAEEGDGGLDIPQCLKAGVDFRSDSSDARAVVSRGPIPADPLERLDGCFGSRDHAGAIQVVIRHSFAVTINLPRAYPVIEGRASMCDRTAAFLSFSLLAASLILVVPKAVFALDAKDLPAAIENAKTAADHEAIAAYFDGEAKAASATAEEHRKMAAAYGKHPKAAGSKGARPTVYRTIRPHCEKLVANYEATAHEYQAMAASHREAAAAIK